MHSTSLLPYWQPLRGPTDQLALSGQVPVPRVAQSAALQGPPSGPGLQRTHHRWFLQGSLEVMSRLAVAFPDEPRASRTQDRVRYGCEDPFWEILVVRDRRPGSRVREGANAAEVGVP